MLACFSAVDEPERTLYTKGVLALPKIDTPPGAAVELSRCDFVSTIRMSPANVRSAKHKVRTAQAAIRALKIPIIKFSWKVNRFVRSTGDSRRCNGKNERRPNSVYGM